MKKFVLPMILGVCLYGYLTDPRNSASANTAPAAAPVRVARHVNVIVAPSPSYASRWKTGPTAQNDWKTGPNAQTDFEPFAPSEQANWNNNPGYTIVSGAMIRR
ncbi:MAG: hypothetical protein ACR2NX_16745 [Chthoniobacterales bacterium]